MFSFEKVGKDHDHWNTILPRLHFFWRFCILPEILARWYTRKCNFLNTGESSNIQFSCFCMRATKEVTVKCSNPLCQVRNFHPSCLKLENFTFKDSWLCPMCQTDYHKKNEKFIIVCICKKKITGTSTNVKSLLKCVNSDCTNGSYFHLDCLGLKRKPNNYKKLWLCSVCKVSSFNQTVDQDVQEELIFFRTFSQPRR